MTLKCPSDLLVVGVDQPKRLRGLHPNSANKKTVSSLSPDGNNHQLYRKYGVYQVDRWIRDLKKKGEYESTRRACKKLPHEELTVADRFYTQDSFVKNVDKGWPGGTDSFLEHLPRILACVEAGKKNPSDQYDVTKRFS